MQATEGVDAIQEIHSNCETNYGVWYVKKGKKKSILKFQESGPGGLEQVRAALDDTKVCDFTSRRLCHRCELFIGCVVFRICWLYVVCVAGAFSPLM